MTPTTEPVTYPGGTMWAIKWPNSPDVEFWGRNEYQARRELAVYTFEAKQDHPDSPELWPQLVRADITWKVVE
jgi:hypothetical protein